MSGLAEPALRAAVKTGELSSRNDTIIVFLFSAKTIIKLLLFLNA